MAKKFDRSCGKVFSIVRVEPSKSSIQEMKSNKNSVAQFLKQYFKFTYFFCICPYRFVNDPKDERRVIIKASILHKVAFGFFHALNWFRIVSVAYDLRGRQLANFEKVDKLIQYFDVCLLVAFVMNGLCEILLSISLWKYKLTIQDILNNVGEINEHLEGHGSRTWVFFMAVTMCSSSFILSLLFTLSGYMFFDLREWSVERWWTACARFGRARLFFPQVGSSSGGNGLSILADSPFAICAMLIILYRQYITYSLAVLLLMFALTFHSFSKEFASLLLVPNTKETMMRQRKLKILTTYNLLKTPIDKVNTVIGPILFAQILSKVAFIPIFVGWTLKGSNWIVKLRDVLEGFALFGIFFISAKATSQVERLADWVKGNNNGVFFTDAEVACLLHDTKKHRVAISGMGLFKVTYAFIGTITSFILTITIIVLEQ